MLMLNNYLVVSGRTSGQISGRWISDWEHVFGLDNDLVMKQHCSYHENARLSAKRSAYRELLIRLAKTEIHLNIALNI